jgi:hypothetical protein
MLQRILQDDERTEMHHRRSEILLGKTPEEKQAFQISYLENIAAGEDTVRCLTQVDGAPKTTAAGAPCKIILIDYRKGGFPSYYRYDPSPTNERRGVLATAYLGLLSYLKRQCSESYKEHSVLFEQLLCLTVDEGEFFYENSTDLLERYLGLRFTSRKEFVDAFGSIKQIACEDLPRCGPSIMFEFSSY